MVIECRPNKTRAANKMTKQKALRTLILSNKLFRFKLKTSWCFFFPLNFVLRAISVFKVRLLFSCDCVCTVAVIDSAVGETGKHAALGFQDNFPFGDNKHALCDLFKAVGS